MSETRDYYRYKYLDLQRRRRWKMVVVINIYIYIFLDISHDDVCRMSWRWHGITWKCTAFTHYHTYHVYIPRSVDMLFIDSRYDMSRSSSSSHIYNMKYILVWHNSISYHLSAYTTTHSVSFHYFLFFIQSTCCTPHIIYLSFCFYLPSNLFVVAIHITTRLQSVLLTILLTPTSTTDSFHSTHHTTDHIVDIITHFPYLTHSSPLYSIFTIYLVYLICPTHLVLLYTYISPTSSPSHFLVLNIRHVLLTVSSSQTFTSCYPYHVHHIITQPLFSFSHSSSIYLIHIPTFKTTTHLFQCVYITNSQKLHPRPS